MYAVIETGGKQYRVEEGMIFEHERIAGIEPGDTVEFDKVLLTVNDSDRKIGTPYLSEAKVMGEVREELKADKIIVYKYKSKTGYRRKQGHRQKYMTTLITDIES